MYAPSILPTRSTRRRCWLHRLERCRRRPLSSFMFLVQLGHFKHKTDLAGRRQSLKIALKPRSHRRRRGRCLRQDLAVLSPSNNKYIEAIVSANRSLRMLTRSLGDTARDLSSSVCVCALESVEALQCFAKASRISFHKVC